MKNNIIVMLLLISLISCKNNNEQKIQENKDFKISSNIKGYEDGTKVIISNAVNGKVLDSTEIMNGKFESNGIIENPPTQISVLIQNDTKRFLKFLFIGNENIKIEGDLNKLKISGSKYHKYKEDLDQRTDSLDNLRNEKIQQMLALRRENKWNDSLQNQYWSKDGGIIPEIDLRVDKIRRDFINDNINSDFALFELVINKSTFDKEFIEIQLEKLNSNFRNSEYATILKTYINSKDLVKGDTFYDFEAENQRGNNVKFSDFFNDKFVLLEFYSSYCSWCRKAMPEIKKLASENKNNLRVITFNVDSNKEDWLKSYEKNKISWPSLHDDSGKLSEVYTKYRVYVTPTYLLFDKNGKLIRKWNGYNDNFGTEVNQSL